MTIILYPVKHDFSKYIYIKAPCNGDGKKAREIANEHHIYIDTEIAVTPNEHLIMKVKLFKKLNDQNKPILIYTIQYQNLKTGKIIRTDSKHAFYHIDIEELDEKGKWQEIKKIYDSPPDDYEARVNSVLRYSERFNKRIGIEYWLQNIVNFKRDLVYELFDHFQDTFKIRSSHTDVARLISVELMNSQDFNYGAKEIKEKIRNMISIGFQKCKRYEHKNKRPLKIYRNLIQRKRDDMLFPFAILAITDSKSQVWQTCFDRNGDEVTCKDVKPLGKVSYRTP
jgi:hypothetical protein